MKITHNSPDQLVIENNPVWLAVFLSVFGLTFMAIGLFAVSAEPLMGFVFVAAGLGIAIGFNMIFVRRTQLILDRSAQKVLLRRRGWLRDNSLTWEMRYLDRAIVETSRSSDNNTHRAALIINGGMDEGTHPLTIVYSSGRGASRAADAINRWLDSTPATA
ncbi:hypothetical protein Z946_1205 [Sulfitobacter noctilucicola]|uniref:Uncharacterized protein n=1 Tax=Sulfitobacter noctilucicola TaxID=1342301 RepID=A0A7W6M6Q2_9RHOB|nr:hypothetical protein [Sulfitobacter noctilucicola]KIN62348.1 hypothetical protein Z946_1205 [Sulfitobacter noctilucicola]MBB4173118.1 hypothetical protein [Sulfitobacter noctilucicola]